MDSDLLISIPNALLVVAVDSTTATGDATAQRPVEHGKATQNVVDYGPFALYAVEPDHAGGECTIFAKARGAR
jgi:hypothetical protein